MAVPVTPGEGLTEAEAGETVVTVGMAVEADCGYHSEAEGELLEVFAVTGAGQTVTIFVDPHTSRGSDFTEFTDAALEIAKTIRFAGR